MALGLTRQKSLLQLSIPQHPRGRSVEQLVVETWGASRREGSVLSPTSSPPMQWKWTGTETTDLPFPAHAVRVLGYVGRGLALAMLLGHHQTRAEQVAARVHPCHAQKTDAKAAHTLFFQCLDEPGHGGQRLLGKGGLLSELCLPRETCDGKTRKRGLEIPVCVNSSLFPQLPQDRIKLLLWHSNNHPFGSCMSNFGVVLLILSSFLQLESLLGAQPFAEMQ